MLDSFGDGFIAFDADWRIIHCNRAGAAHYDLTREDVLGQLAWSAPGLGEDGALREFLERARANGEAVEAEVQSELRSGRWFFLRAFPLGGGTGLSSRDVTERHEQQRRERETSERLELALATAGFGDWTWDAATDLVDLSPRAAQMVGVLPGRVMTWTEQLAYLHVDDRDRAAAAVVEALATRGVYELEYRFNRPLDAELRWMMVRGRGVYDEAGQPIGMQGVLTDITEEKAEAEAIRADRARLAESEARFRAMADSAPSPVWVTDQDGKLEFVNQCFTEWAGKPHEALQGLSWTTLLHPEDRARIDTRRNRARARMGSDGWDARYQVASGEWRWMRTASRPRFDEAGVFQGHVGLAMDVTHARRAEEHQRLLINELNHRVKNTLATIQSLARQTLREGVSVGDARERLTDRLLALSAAHNVLTRENWEGADLAEIAQEAMRPYQEPAGRVGLSGPHVRLAPNVALALSMAFHELATNALKYGALSSPEGRLDLAWKANGGGIRLTWTERGGPPVTPPAATGFGSRLLAGLAGELGAPAQIDYATDGLTCVLQAPVA